MQAPLQLLTSMLCSFDIFFLLFLVEEERKQDRKMVIDFATIKGHLSFSSSGLGPDLE